ncbi:MAG: HD domain-containing protein [Candidatus Weimeria sp.]
MILDRKKVRGAFKKYTGRYDLSDPKIQLKAVHTYHVAENADEIARSLDLSENDTDLAWLLGMLHDLGRFEQVRKYQTFDDGRSVSHAHLSCEILFPEYYHMDKSFLANMPNGSFGQISDFIDEASDEEYDLIRTAIWEHSSYRIPDDLNSRQEMFCNIIRDADKIDIFRVNVEESMADVYNADDDEITGSGTSERVIQAVREHTCVKRDPAFSMTYADHILSHACLAFELEFPVSRVITNRQGYLKKLVSFRSDNPTTQAAEELLRKELSSLGFTV